MKASFEKRPKTLWIVSLLAFAGLCLTAWFVFRTPDAGEDARNETFAHESRATEPLEDSPSRADAVSEELPAPADFGAWAMAPVVAPDFQKIDAFQSWLQRWKEADPSMRDALVEEGVARAEERRLEFKRLIATDPKLALDLAVARVIRQDLPESIVSRLEKPVSATGQYDVLMARPEPGSQKPSELVLRYFEVEGMSYIARVYGEMTPVMSRKNIPLRGVAVDREFAVAESPVRSLEIGERIAAGTLVEKVCPVSGEETQAPASGESVKVETPVIEVGERVITLCNGSHVEVMDEKYKTLIQAAGPGGASFFMDTYPGTSSRAIGNLRCLYIRGTYPDRLEQLNTEDQAAADMANTARFFSETSFGKCSLTTTITPMVVLPHTFSWYTTKDSEVNGLGLLQTHARIEARRLGYDSTQFDCIILRINGLRSGASWGGGDSVWLGWGGMDVINHEVGHSLGLNHANFWQASDGTAYGNGANQEYGNPFDVMGGGGGFGAHYNTVSKRQVGWLPANYIHSPRENGVYRIHAYDQPRLEEGKRYGLTVAKDSIRSYNIEYHPQGSSTLLDSALVIYSGMGSNAGHLLDTTPGSSGGKNDGGIQVGRTFSDEEADMHFTVLSKQDTSPPSLDVAFMRGPFPGNVAPSCTLTASSTTLAVGQVVTLTASAVDTNGDDLSYYWQFDDGSSAANSPVVTRSFSAVSQVTAMVTVSDMKGGTVRRHVVLNIGSHGRQTVSGTVTVNGTPLPNVRVASGSKFCVTDQDGNYAISGLSTGSQTLTATLNGYTFTPDFVNPLNVVSGVNTANWTAAANMPFVTLVKNADVTENGAAGSFTLTRTGDNSAALVVRVSPQGGTATKTTDYNFTPDFVADGSYRTFTIPAGQSSLVVSVAAANDTAAEGPETISLQLASNGTYLSTVGNAMVMTVFDDDTVLPQVALRLTDAYATEFPADPGTMTLTRTGPTTASLSVALAFTGTATNGTDYQTLASSVVIPAGQSSVNLTVSPINDTNIEGPEEVIATISTNAAYLRDSSATTTTVTITDDDTPTVSLSLLDASASESGPDNAVFLVTRTGSTAAPLKVFYGMSGTAYHGTDYAGLSGEITIPAGQASAPIVITPYSDDLGESTETVTISLTTFNNAYSVAEEYRLSATIADANDVPVVSVRTGTVGVEGGANATVVFRSVGSTTGNVTVNYTVSGTATSGSDFTTLSGTITLPAAGPSDVTLTIPVINDTSAEATETVFVQITPGTGYRVYNDGYATAFIRDNDSGDRVMVSTYNDSPAEGGGTGRFYLHRAGATTSDLVVNYTLSGTATDGVDYTGLTGTATILAGEVGVNVPLTVVDDSTAEGTETLMLQLQPGAGYGLDWPSFATFEIGDNDALPLSLGFQTATSATTEQLTSTGEYRDIPVVLSAASTSTVSVRYASGGGSAMGDDVDWAFVDAAAGNAIIPQGTLTFAPGVTSQNIRIRLKNDGVAEPIESLIIELRAASGAALATGLNRYTLMIGDDSVSGLVLEERWSGSSVYTNQTWSSSAPSVSNYLTSFTTAQNVADNYSRRLTGQIVAPTTGAYRFWIASDDDSRLYLSTTSSAANKVQIASLAGWSNFQNWDANASQRSAWINLAAGQSYYMEVQQTEGGGGDHVSVAWEGPGITRQAIPAQTPESQATRYVRLLQNSSNRREADGTEPMLIAVLDRPVGTSPVSVSISATGTATAGVDYLLPAGPLVFSPGEQMKAIPLSLLTDAVAEMPESILISLVASDGLEVLNPSSHFITLRDDSAPVVQSQILTATSQMAVGTVLGTVSASVAEGRSVVGWSIVGGNLGGAFSISSTGVISLQNPTALPNPGSRGLLVRATDNLGAAGDGLISVDCNPPAVIGVREQRWSGSTAYNNQSWTGATNYSGALSTFTTPQNVAENYSRRLTGYLRPSISGNYTFWIASDDASRLFLGTNSLESSKVQIAGVSGYTGYQSWDSNTSQKSALIPLVAGQIYWMEVHQQDGAGGDHVSVAWSGPGISREAIPVSAIYTPGDVASSPVAPMVALTAPEAGASYVQGEVVGLAAQVIDGSEPVQAVEFYRGSSLISSDASEPYEASWVAGSIGAQSLSAKVLTTGGTVTSATVSVTVISGNQPPAFTSDPLYASATAPGLAYTGTLASAASDPNAGDVLTFSKVSGPAWLSVASNGTLSGTPSSADVGPNDFLVQVADQLGASATTTLRIDVIPQEFVWTQPAGGSWALSSNWWGGYIASGVGATASFDSLNLSASATVTLDQNRTVGSMRFADTTPSHHWTLASGTGGVLTLDVESGQPTIQVINQSVTIGAMIAGNKGFIKNGGGELLLTNANSYSGMTTVNAGTLTIGNTSGSATGVSAVNVAASATLSGHGSIAGSVTLAGNLTSAGGQVGTLTTGALSLVGSPTLEWQVSDWSGAAGVGCDLVSASSLNLDSLTQANIVLQPKDLVNFTNQSKAFPLIRTVSGVTGFSASEFVIDATALPQATGTWSVAVVGTDLVLQYTRSNTSPNFISNPLTASGALEDSAYSSSLTTSVEDQDLGETLVFEKLSGPSWLTVGENGVLSGTPSNADVGWNEWTVRVTDSFASNATTTLRILVSNVNDAPTFATNLMDVGSVLQGASIAGSIADQAQDVDLGDTLTFSKVSGPAWLSVAGNGTLSGVPGNANVGVNTIVVRVTDSAGAFAQSDLQVMVINVNDAPTFTTNLIDAGTVLQGASVAGSIADQAQDVDLGDTLTFSKVSGPAWLSVAGNGMLSGVPGNANVGLNTIVVRVTDAAGAFAQSDLQVMVINVNDAPTFTTNLIDAGTVLQGASVAGSVANQAQDVDLGDTLTFSKVSGPAWLSVAGNGTLSGVPGNANVGLNTIVVRATDAAGAFAQSDLKVIVINVNDAPTFATTPINGGTVKALANFNGSLSGTASDIDAGDAISFSKISGPAWLTVATNGAMSGTPAVTHVGTNTFVVRVTDTVGSSADATLNVTVTPANVAPAFVVNPITGASVVKGNPYSSSLSGTAVDADAGDVISYAKVSGPAWLSVATNGALSGTPAAANVGANAFIVSATDSSGASAQATLNIQVLNLPLPWLVSNIGTGNLAGSATFLSNAFTLSGSGLLAGTADGGYYTYQTLSGDGEIIARIDQMQNTGTSSRVGVMIRNTLASNAQYTAMTATGTGAYRWSRRTAAGAKSTVTNHGNGTLPNVWVRLTRVGNTFTSFTSANGTTWTNVGSVTMTLNANCFVGLYVASGSSTSLNTSRFVNVTVTP
ncbi:MAG: hypothetical protein RLZZ553_961 [Verrucomicrobiota bacterium]